MHRTLPTPTPLPAPPPWRIGLTGGLASGKSTVEALLRKQGLPVWDADTCVHNLLRNDAELKASLISTFGPCIVDEYGYIDRKALGGIVFADARKRQQLEQLIHPKVRLQRAQFFEHCSQLQPTPLLVVASIPLLFEQQLEAEFHEVWLVACSAEQQLERLMQRNGFSLTEAQQRLAAQWPLAKKRPLATRILDNSGPPGQLLPQVNTLLESF